MDEGCSGSLQPAPSLQTDPELMIPESQTPDTFPTPPKKPRTFQAGQPDPHVFILLTAPSSPARPPLLAAGAAKREARGCGTRR